MTSTPFPTIFPHIIRLPDDRIVELSCPICSGNARSSSPHHFFNGARAVTNHIARIHNDPNFKNTKDLLTWTGLRVLTTAEYKCIENGDYADIIEKRAVANKHGQHAQRVKDKDSMPIPHYPHIVLLKDGIYIQLKCFFCRSNAQTQRGGNRFGENSTSKLVFFDGVAGMRGHVANAHKAKMGAQKVSYNWVARNCGEELPEEVIELLMVDTVGAFLEMVKAPGKDEEGVESEEVDGESESESDVAEDGIGDGGEDTEGEEPHGSMKG